MTPLIAPFAPPTPAPPKTLTGHLSVYLAGIGGTGMCGAAELLAARGIRVHGSDRQTSPRTERLRRLGVEVDVGEDPARVPADATLLVHSAAVPPSHPLLEEARRRGLEVWKYADCLGALMEDRLSIAVAGCHGKTTTSSLVAATLWRAGRDPSFVIGGEVKDLRASARAGAGPHFVAEACEFDRSFHRLRPRVAIVTNVDEDHLDYYRDLREIEESFREFARRLPREGLLVVHEAYACLFRDDPAVVARIETYGPSRGADWRAVPTGWDAEAHANRFDVSRGGDLLGSVALPLAGSHNVLNATAAIAALAEAGLTFGEIAAGFACFGGVGRRLEHVAEANGVLILDDYGHHPAEIEAVVHAVRGRWPGRRLVIAFQPHQASRTRCLLEGFARALSMADEAFLPPIYFARDSEEERRSVSSRDLAARMRALGGSPTTFPDLGALVAHAATSCRPGDVLVTMGAGDVDEAARRLAARLGGAP
jgi:UDP-N-acetylmuramate--alanine ligase